MIAVWILGFHKYPLLAGGRVDGHRVIEVLLGCAHVHRDAEPLHHLIDASAHTLAADDTLSFTVTL